MALWNVIPRHLPKARKISLRLMAGPENPENGDQINIEEPKISNRNKHDSDDISRKNNSSFPLKLTINLLSH